MSSVYIYSPTYKQMCMLCANFDIPISGGANVHRWINHATMVPLLRGTYQPIIIMCSCETLLDDDMQILKTRHAVILPLVCKCSHSQLVSDW